MLRSRTKHPSFAETSDASGRFSIRGFEGVGLRTVEREFEAGEMIFEPGDPDDRIHFVLSGVVRIYRTYGYDREATTALVQAGGTIGNPDLVEGSWHDSYAEAKTSATVASARKTHVEQVVRRNPEFALGLFTSVFERLQQADGVIDGLLYRDVSTRLAILLLNLADRFGVKKEPGVTLDIRLTQNDLANMTASTREAVSKAMNEFQREGYIETGSRKEIGSRRITLVDQAALAGCAYGSAQHDGRSPVR